MSNFYRINSLLANLHSSGVCDRLREGGAKSECPVGLIHGHDSGTIFSPSGKVL
jgi:hypothetical protein